MINGQSGGVMGNQVGPLRAWALKQNLKNSHKLHPLDATVTHAIKIVHIYA